jgi:hypothetical protein
MDLTLAEVVCPIGLYINLRLAIQNRMAPNFHPLSEGLAEQFAAAGGYLPGMQRPLTETTRPVVNQSAVC